MNLTLWAVELPAGVSFVFSNPSESICATKNNEDFTTSSTLLIILLRRPLDLNINSGNAMAAEFGDLILVWGYLLKGSVTLSNGTAFARFR